MDVCPFCNFTRLIYKGELNSILNINTLIFNIISDTANSKQTEMYPQMTFAEIRSQEIVTIISNAQIETFISRGCCIKIRTAISMCLVQFTDSWILRSRNVKFQVALVGLSS